MSDEMYKALCVLSIHHQCRHYDKLLCVEQFSERAFFQFESASHG